MTNEKDTPGTPEHGRQRFAKRVSGEGWTAEVAGVAGEVRVLKLSRIGIEIETVDPLESGARYPIRLTHGGETTRTTFYVLRCPEHRNGRERPSFRPAGLFVETLERTDLPEVIPARPTR
ncbi:MAG TPA: hypothetical protein VG777_08540 [Thermoanaerobaculia bacterium]|nr:hypothetical protein [Thermoanaerobaculia bacterium]